MSYSKDIEELGLLGERLSLDFVNTTGTHPHNENNDFLLDYPHLLTWAKYVCLISEGDANLLLRLAENQPDEAAGALEQAVTLREIVYRVLAAEARENAPDESDMFHLVEALSDGLTQMTLARGENGRYAWAWAGDSHDLARMVWPVIWDAAELLKSDALHSVRQCAGDTCDWLFLDTSRNHSRRWCDMQSCGNRAKARSHYHRARDTAQDT